MRSRSLRSIVFKLSNGLISVSELVNEKEFLAHLLEWFNHDEWVLESQVLTLIEQLAQVSGTPHCVSMESCLVFVFTQSFIYTHVLYIVPRL